MVKIETSNIRAIVEKKVYYRMDNLLWVGMGTDGKGNKMAILVNTNNGDLYGCIDW